MSDDIVARIRMYANASIDGGWATVFRSDLNIAADEIERLRKERDEARQRLCKVVGDNRDMWGEDVAKEYGWDCFKKEDEQ